MTLMQRNRRMLILLAALIGLTGGAAWASVPLYDWFCRVTGYGGTPLTQTTSSVEQILDRTIQIRFDASLARGMPWDFRPVDRELDVKIGESVLTFYEASNPTSKAIVGTASYNVYPFKAGGYFVKVDCFCFEEQVLLPGESVLMPVNFYVDPDIINDQEASSTATITLSYTFHQKDNSNPPPEAELADELRASEPIEGS